jgi:hypothetical protein
MNMRDKLKELRENILRDRSALIAWASDTLWSDTTLLRYIKDAEYRFAKQTLIIRDSETPEIVRVTLRAGVTNYKLHPLVLGLVSAKYDTDTIDLQRIGHSLLSRARDVPFLTFDATTISTLSPGRPQGIYTDEALSTTGEGKVVLSVYPTPSAAEAGKVLYLRVYRLPKTSYTLSASKDDCGEIPEVYELDVLEWAAYRAQRNYDADGASLTTADSHKERFDMAVKEALKDIRRKRYVPPTLGLGANGFTYTR